jgi:capsular polysaccharide biosynthesis protein
LPGVAAALLRLLLAVRPADVRALTELQAIAVARGERAEAIRLGERLLAIDPDNAQFLWNVAVLALQANDANAALRCFARRDALASGGSVATRLCTDSLFDPERAARGEPYVGRARDVLVETALWSVIDNDKVYVREAHDRTIANGPFVAGRVLPDGKRFVISLPAPAITVGRSCVLLGGDENYAHWVIRNLLKLALVDARPALAQLPLLINDDLRPYQREFLELLGIADERLIKVPRGVVVSCRDLVVPTQLRNHPRMIEGIDWLRARLAAWMATGPARDLLFVSRRDTPVRTLLNEAELESALHPLGFRTVVPGAMSVREQVRAFSSAAAIVAPHGAGLANLVFAPRGAAVIEIASSNIAQMADFRHIAQALGQRIVTLVSEDYDLTRAEALAANWDYRADVGQVLRALEDTAPETLSRTR